MSRLIVTLAVTTLWGAIGEAKGEDASPAKGLGGCLHVVYFNPAGRAPAKGYRERLDRTMTDIQGFHRDEMKRNGFGPMSGATAGSSSARRSSETSRSAASAWTWPASLGWSSSSRRRRTGRPRTGGSGSTRA